tara:strand:- start:950 stop:1294 length:345 start_codon:yes stop_codon:yes gene_type:complete
MALPDFKTDTALIVLDVQKAIDDPRWESKNNPGYIDAIANLLAKFRAASLPVIHVRHQEANPASTFYANGPGQPFKDEATPVDDETVFDLYAAVLASEYCNLTQSSDVIAALPA